MNAEPEVLAISDLPDNTQFSSGNYSLGRYLRNASEMGGHSPAEGNDLATTTCAKAFITYINPLTPNDL
jgi:hypothetical protein